MKKAGIVCIVLDILATIGLLLGGWAFPDNIFNFIGQHFLLIIGIILLIKASKKSKK